MVKYEEVYTLKEYESVAEPYSPSSSSTSTSYNAEMLHKSLVTRHFRSITRNGGLRKTQQLNSGRLLSTKYNPSFTS